MRQQNEIKMKKTGCILGILMVIFSLILIVSIFLIEIFSEEENEGTVIVCLFIAIFAGLGLFVSFILIMRLEKKYTKLLNEALEPGLQVVRKVACCDLLDSALMPVKKKTDFTCMMGIIGKVEDIDFEYYHFRVAKETLFFDKNLGFMDLYVYNNLSIFQQDIVITAGKEVILTDKLKKFEVGEYTICAENEDNWMGLILPKDTIFLSVVDHTAYLFLKTEENEFSKPYAFKSKEEFKEAVDLRLETTKKLYEESKAWLK